MSNSPEKEGWVRDGVDAMDTHGFMDDRRHLTMPEERFVHAASDFLSEPTVCS